MLTGDTLSGFWAIFNRWNPFGQHPNIPTLTDIQARFPDSPRVRLTIYSLDWHILQVFQLWRKPKTWVFTCDRQLEILEHSSLAPSKSSMISVINMLRISYMKLREMAYWTMFLDRMSRGFFLLDCRAKDLNALSLEKQDTGETVYEHTWRSTTGSKFVCSSTCIDLEWSNVCRHFQL